MTRWTKIATRPWPGNWSGQGRVGLTQGLSMSTDFAVFKRSNPPFFVDIFYIVSIKVPIVLSIQTRFNGKKRSLNVILYSGNSYGGKFTVNFRKSPERKLRVKIGFYGVFNENYLPCLFWEALNR